MAGPASDEAFEEENTILLMAPLDTLIIYADRSLWIEFGPHGSSLNSEIMMNTASLPSTRFAGSRQVDTTMMEYKMDRPSGLLQL